MAEYVLRRFIYMLLMLAVVTLVAWVIIQLPPGDYLTMYIANLEVSGQRVEQHEIDALRRTYGLDQPQHIRYLRWVSRMTRGDFGRSIIWNRSVTAVIGDRLAMTVVLSISSLIFTYVVAISVGIYSAIRQYSPFDYTFTVLGFIGLATPNFLLALILMVAFNSLFGLNIGGLFSPEFRGAAWSFAKFIDMLKHLPVPIIVVGTAGTAGLIRVMRSMMLDELKKQYVVTARTKGLKESKLIFRYPVRVALNPIISTVGWVLPAIVSGETITALVLSLPTVGPLLFQALRQQDVYLAGTLVLFLCFLTIVGTFISDMLLIAIDPRIKLDKARV